MNMRSAPVPENILESGQYYTALTLPPTLCTLHCSNDSITPGVRDRKIYQLNIWAFILRNKEKERKRNDY